MLVVDDGRECFSWEKHELMRHGNMANIKGIELHTINHQFSFYPFGLFVWLCECFICFGITFKFKSANNYPDLEACTCQLCFFFIVVCIAHKNTVA